MKSFMRWTILFVTISSFGFAGSMPVVAIQPLGPVKEQYIAAVKAGITAIYAVNVEILPGNPLPDSAWYAPRGRYKADKLLGSLENGMPARFTKIIGLTASDISTTNDDGNDWGIFGLGQLGGKACVVSTFRLRAGNAGEKLFQTRLVKVVNHELGHTFGVDHCPVAACLMQDKRGKITSVDAENGNPCAVCAARMALKK